MACGLPDDSEYWFAARKLRPGERGFAGLTPWRWDDGPPRTAIWARAGADVQRIEVRGPGGRVRPTIARGRGFAVVYPATVAPDSVTVTFFLDDGLRAPPPRLDEPRRCAGGGPMTRALRSLVLLALVVGVAGGAALALATQPQEPAGAPARADGVVVVPAEPRPERRRPDVDSLPLVVDEDSVALEQWMR